jgi:hypothetical protein
VSRFRRLDTDVPPRRHGFGSIRSQCMWELWRTTRYWDRFFSGYFGSPLSVSFHHAPYSSSPYGTDRRVQPGYLLTSNVLPEIGGIVLKSTSIGFNLQKVKDNEMGAACSTRKRNYKYTESFDRYIWREETSWRRRRWCDSNIKTDIKEISRGVTQCVRKVAVHL